MHRLISSTKRFQFTSIDLSTLTIGLMLFNYGLFGYGLSLSKSNLSSVTVGSRTVIYNCLLLVCTYFLIKETRKSLIKIRIEWQVLLFTFLLTLIAVLGNLPLYQTYLNGDELAYVSNSWLHSAKIIEDFSITGSKTLSESRMLDLIKIPIVLACLAIGVTLFAAKKILWNYQPLIFTCGVVILQQSNANYFNFSFQYLSGYVFAPVISSVLFSNDFAIRIGNTTFFYFLVILGLRQKKSRITSMIWIFPVAAMLLIPAFSNFLPVVDTVSYFVSFGFIILFRLLGGKSYAIQSTLWISCISIFFRPANIVWLILVLAYVYHRERRLVKEKVFYIPILLVLPFVADVAMQKMISIFHGFTTMESAETNHSYFEAYYPYFRSVYRAYDKSTFLLLGILVIFLVFHTATRFLISIYLLVILFVYIPLIPPGISGHNKYAFETTLPLVFVAFCRLFRIMLDQSSQTRKRLIIPVVVLSISYVGTVQRGELSADKIIDSRGQLENFYGYPLESRLDLTTLEKLTPDHVCINTGSIYGDSYFYLRGERLLQLSDRRIREHRLTSNSATRNIFDENDCLVIDSMRDKSNFTEMLSKESWERVYYKLGSNFGTSSEVWVKPN